MKEKGLYKCTQQAYRQLIAHLGTRERNNLSKYTYQTNTRPSTPDEKVANVHQTHKIGKTHIIGT